MLCVRMHFEEIQFEVRWRITSQLVLAAELEGAQHAIGEHDNFSKDRAHRGTLEMLGESAATHDSQSASRSGVEAWVARNLNGWDESDARTSQGWGPVPERTGKLAPLTPFYSIIVPVVQFFGRSSFLLWQIRLVRLRLTLPHFWSIAFGPDRTHASPVRTRAPDSPNLSTRECKHCGASLGWHAPFSSMKTKTCPFEEMSPTSGYLPRNARWRSEGKAGSREDEMAVSPGFESSHWLFSLCFRAPTPNTAERSQSINGHQSRKRNFGHQSSISCVWKTDKEGQNACRSCFWKTGKEGEKACQKKSRSYCPNWGQLNTRCSWWRNKEQGSCTGILFREEIIVNQSQRKARSKYGICAGFWFDRGGHKAKLSDARFILYTSLPARRCQGIRAPRWTSALRASGRLRSAF